MHHCVCVLHADTVGATVGLHDVHDSVVRIVKRPVALPLKHHGERGDRLRASLNNALHGILMGKLADIAAAVLDYIDFIVVVNRLDGGQRDASLRPEAGQRDLLAPGILDCGNKLRVVPGVHRDTHDRLLLRESFYLRPHFSAEGLGLNHGQQPRQVENFAVLLTQYYC